MKKRAFSWKALNKDGEILQGVWEVPHLNQVRKLLFAQGYYPLAITPRSQILIKLLEDMGHFLKRGEYLKDWVYLTRRLGMILQSGVPMLMALELLEKRSKNKGLKGWSEVKGKIKAGGQLSEAVELFNPPPAPHIKAMLEAGEQGGKLSEVLAQIAQELEGEYKFRLKMRNAFAYPVFLLLFTFLLLFVLNILVIPMFEEVFLSMGVDTPFLTRVIFKGFPLVLLGSCLLVLGFLGYILFLRWREPSQWKWIMLEYFSKIPFWGQLISLMDSMRLCRVLGILLDSGVNILEALRLTKGAVLTISLKNILGDMEEAARKGQPIATVLRKTSQFSDEGGQMIAIGEETGQLSLMLDHVSQILAMDLEEEMAKVIQRIGPLLIMGMSVIIGLVASGVFLPILEVGKGLQ